QGQVRDSRHTYNFHAAVAGHQHFGYGGHANGVGAPLTQQPQLGARLVIGACNHNVYALTQRDVTLGGRFSGNFEQFGVVGRVHGREAGAEGRVVGAVQGVVPAPAEEVDVVGNEHQVARLEIGVEASRRVGHD